MCCTSNSKQNIKEVLVSTKQQITIKARIFFAFVDNRKLYKICLFNHRGAPYVILVGDAGTGKSTLVEKLTKVKGRSSNAMESFTRTSEAFYVPNDTLIVSDTPGSNSRKDKLQHNVWIAAAFNLQPVSKVFIVVKAEMRMDSVIDDVRKYADSFLDFPPELVGVLVTHMDVVEWTETCFSSALSEDLGIDSVVFSTHTTGGEKLLRDILATCKEQHNLTVDHENFLKLFKIHNRHRNILKNTMDEVNRFREMKRSFDIERQKYKNEKEQVDLAFEFQAYMTEEITRAQQRISEKNGFTFFGEKAADEAGHIANMVNQLRQALYDIRVECLKYQSDQSASELRRCPYCGKVWAKVEGCDAQTTCGNRPTIVNDMRDKEYSVLSTYTFIWSGDSLRIEKSGEKKVSSSVAPKNLEEKWEGGCGRSITWSAMPKAEVPPEFSAAAKISTDDIKVLPPEASNFQHELSGMIKMAQYGMKLSKPGR